MKHEAVAWRELMTRARWIEVARIAGTGLIALLYWRGLLPLPVLLAAVAVGLFPLVRTAALDLVHERKIGTEVFITIATTLALLTREYVAGAVLLTIILIAEFIADLNIDRARATIKALIGSVPQTALVRRNGAEELIPLAELRVDDIVLVRAGEKIPVDGTVVHGGGSVNQAPITGESIPQEKTPGSTVFAGTVVELGALDVQTDKVGGDTLFGRIIALVEQAEAQQAPVQKLADRVAAWLIPLVFVFLLVVYLVTHDVRVIITLLIFTSPAELALATPMVMIAAIARAAHDGILVKGGVYLEELAKVDVVVFDKTGTLTRGQPEVVRIETFDSAASETDLLRLAGAAERRSSHPLAKAIVEHAQQRLTVPEPSEFTVIRGRGVTAVIDGSTVLAGSPAWLTEQGIVLPPASDGAGETAVYVASGGRALGYIELADRVRPGAKEAVTRLKQTGIMRVVMLTGDSEAVAQRVAAEVGVDEVEADLLPEDKVTAIQELKRGGHTVAMVGDGINDAPALAMADVGIAMGVAGTQAALEAADVALMTDDLSKIVEARALAARAYRTIKENLLFGVGVVHVVGILAGLARLIGPIQAAMIHLGPDVLVFLNSVKLLRVRLSGAGDARRT